MSRPAAALEEEAFPGDAEEPRRFFNAVVCARSVLVA